MRPFVPFVFGALIVCVNGGALRSKSQSYQLAPSDVY